MVKTEEIRTDVEKKIKRIIRWHEFADMDQQNPHHHATLGDHMIIAANYVEDQSGIMWRNPLDGHALHIAALFHDCGKPEKAKMRNGIMTYWGHADASAEKFLAATAAIPEIAEERWAISEWIRRHDDFISYRDGVPTNHAFLREITPETVAEKIFERNVRFRQGLTDIQKRYLCRLAITGNSELFKGMTAEEALTLEENVLQAHPAERTGVAFYRDLMCLCKADAYAQAKSCEVNGVKYTREGKMAVFDKIATVIPEAQEIANRAVAQMKGGWS